MSKQDGGPAFPGEYVSKRLDGKPNEWRYFPGMTLRDWFAGQALAGISNESMDWHYGRGEGLDWYGAMSGDAYKIADAMLAERAKE